uniref:Ig-like domain-containing protein n=1 Tax=Callorhinchus milii TaxID=7868 RepID=A0A4W3GHC4_CALMI
AHSTRNCGSLLCEIGSATTVKIEGQSEVIECTYSTTVGYYYLFWYRHYPDQQPEFIFRSYSNRDNPVKGPGFGNRFTAELHKSIPFTGLTISELVLSDSAVYYCAFTSHHIYLLICLETSRSVMRRYIK